MLFVVCSCFGLIYTFYIISKLRYEYMSLYSYCEVDGLSRLQLLTFVTGNAMQYSVKRYSSRVVERCTIHHSLTTILDDALARSKLSDGDVYVMISFLRTVSDSDSSDIHAGSNTLSCGFVGTDYREGDGGSKNSRVQQGPAQIRS